MTHRGLYCKKVILGKTDTFAYYMQDTPNYRSLYLVDEFWHFGFLQ